MDKSRWDLGDILWVNCVPLRLWVQSIQGVNNLSEFLTPMVLRISHKIRTLKQMAQDGIRVWVTLTIIAIVLGRKSSNLRVEATDTCWGPFAVGNLQDC